MLFNNSKEDEGYDLKEIHNNVNLTEISQKYNTSKYCSNRK